MDQVVFLHAADLHLGSPLRSSGNVPPGLLEKIRDAGYTALVRLVDAAITHDVDFVVLCGDIYDQEERSARAKRFFIDQMERLNSARIPVYLVYGNHDPISGQTGYFIYPENVHVFPGGEVEAVEVEGRDGRVKARLLGQSYGRRAEQQGLHAGYTPPARDLVNIGLLHTALNPGQHNYAPCTAGDLKSIPGIDYWALGHKHQRQVVHAPHPTIAYPGIPQGRNMRETGVGGCLLVTVRREQAARLQFIPTSPVAWLSCEVPLKGDESSEDELYDAIAGLLEQTLATGAFPGVELAPGESGVLGGCIIQWVFSGRSEVHEMVAGDSGRIAQLVERINREYTGRSPFVWTEEVIFQTTSPLVDFDNISPEDTVMQTLQQVYNDCRSSDGADRKEIVARMGSGWFEQADLEDTRDRAFPLHEETYQAILRAALEMAAERIMKGREQV